MRSQRQMSTRERLQQKLAAKREVLYSPDLINRLHTALEPVFIRLEKKLTATPTYRRREDNALQYLTDWNTFRHPAALWNYLRWRMMLMHLAREAWMGLFSLGESEITTERCGEVIGGLLNKCEPRPGERSHKTWMFRIIFIHADALATPRLRPLDTDLYRRALRDPLDSSTLYEYFIHAHGSLVGEQVWVQFSIAVDHMRELYDCNFRPGKATAWWIDMITAIRTVRPLPPITWAVRTVQTATGIGIVPTSRGKACESAAAAAAALVWGDSTPTAATAAAVEQLD